MTTIGAHKLLIACAILFSLGPIVWGVRHGLAGDGTGWAVAAGGLLAAVALGVYLRSFLARHPAHRERAPGESNDVR